MLIQHRIQTFLSCASKMTVEDMQVRSGQRGGCFRCRKPPATGNYNQEIVRTASGSTCGACVSEVY